MSGCESEKDRVMSQFPLYSSLPCFCPRAAFHPHYRNSDGTFLPPPLLVFSFSLHVLFLSRFLPLFAPFVSRTLFVCHSWTLPSSFWHFFLCLILSSIPHSRCFSDIEHIKKKKKILCLCVCVFVCVSTICLLHSKTQRLSMRIWSLHCQWNVVTVLLLKLFLVK